MLRERVSTDIYVFTSELYVQVTAAVVVTTEGAVAIDTLPLPIESREMAEFIAYRCPSGVRYVVLTHHHADHTYGAYLYPDARIVAHTRCYELLAALGQQGLEHARLEAPELEEVSIRLPDVTLESGEMNLHVGNKTLKLLWTPGHSDDMLSVLVEEERVLLASDTVMPVPVIVDGDLEVLKDSLLKVRDLRPESIVQGHGEVILRGEVQLVVQSSIDYLDKINELVEQAIQKGKPREWLEKSDIEDCGLSRVVLDGRAQQLHLANLVALYDRAGQRDG